MSEIYRIKGVLRPQETKKVDSIDFMYRFCEEEFTYDKRKKSKNFKRKDANLAIVIAGMYWRSLAAYLF